MASFIRDWHQAFIGIGSNLNQPVEQVFTAFESLKHLPESEWMTASSLYASKPQGPQDQPDFVNAVVQIRTRLSPLALLDELQSLEQSQGKVKKRHWGERLIDLDVLLYDDEVIEHERLLVPHPYLTQRDFVLLPLQEIAPDLVLPDGKKIPGLVDSLSETFVVPLETIRSSS